MRLLGRCALLILGGESLCGRTGVRGRGYWAVSEVAPVERSLAEAVTEFSAAHCEDVRISEAQYFFFESDADDDVTRTTEAREWRRLAFPPADENEAALSRGSSMLDRVAPSPFGAQDLARVSLEPVFSLDECAAIVAEAEAESAWRRADPIASFARGAASFAPVRDLPRTSRWLDKALETTLLPQIARAFEGVDALATPSYLRVSAASVLRYNASAGQTQLGLHRDGPLVAGTVALNDEYEGGGTFVEAADDVLRAPAGHVVLHPGTLRHAGQAITRGLRYILVFWVFSTRWSAPEHFALRRANGFLSSALKTTSSGDDTTRRIIRVQQGSSPSFSSSSEEEHDEPLSFRDALLIAAANGFEEALALQAERWTEAAHLGLAQSLLELRQPRDALLLFDRALELAPTNALAADLRRAALAQLAPPDD